jgi:3-hydroxyisobutyrate dehydrogenase-like beta-hydroxyacid dehydrogenase
VEFAKIADTHVGVVGLGKMGSAIALNLLTRGYRVSVWNRSPDPVGPLVERGATQESSPKALAETVDVAIVSLWGDDASWPAAVKRRSNKRGHCWKHWARPYSM